MPCPFPGMDPFLENRNTWPAFHSQLITAMYQDLLPKLGENYCARIAERRYVTEASVEWCEKYLEIREPKSAGLVTLVDVVSPANTVLRTIQPERYEIYIATLQKRLPRFRLPLAPTDRDAVLDLQGVFTRTYEQGGFADHIDYRHEPATSLKDVASQRIREILGLQRPFAEPSLSHEEIALAAYYIWMEQGCPHGRADEHWRLAMERLKQVRDSR